MKFLIKTLLIAGLCYLFESFVAWWIVAVISFVINLLIPTTAFNSFLSGFCGVGFLWFGFAWGMDIASGSILTGKMASLLGLGDQAFILVIITGLVGGVVGGLSGINSRYFYLMLVNRKSRNSDVYKL